MSNIPIRELRDKVTKEVFYPKTHVKAVAGLEDITFFELAIVNGQHTVKLKDDYAGLWANGFGTFGGVGTGGGGGGSVSYLNDLTDVTVPNPSNGDLLSYSNGIWSSIPQSSITPDLSGYGHALSLSNDATYLLDSYGNFLLDSNGNYLVTSVLATTINLLNGSGTVISSVTLPTQSVNLQGFVPNTRTINGHPLSADVTISKSDIGLGNVENTALSTWAGTSNITTLGTIATGVWNATEIGVTKGGTGLTSVAKGDILYASASNTIAALSANGTSTKKYLSQTSDNAPVWGEIDFADLPAMYVAQTQVSSSAANKVLYGIDAISYNTSSTSASNDNSRISWSSNTWTVKKNLSVGGTLSVTGAAQMSSTLSVADAITLSGNTDAKRRIYFGDSSHYVELDSNGFHFSHGIYSEVWVAAGGVGSGNGSGSVTYLTDLEDVNASSPSTNDILYWSGTAWVNTAVKTVGGTSLFGTGNIAVGGGTTYTAGAGIDITGSTLSVKVAGDINTTGSTIGGIKVGSVLSTTPSINAVSATAGKYYYVECDANGVAFVNVPWVAGSSSGGTLSEVGLTMPTGFEVVNSPLTSNGALEVTFATGYSLPTTTKQGQWDTAYSTLTSSTAKNRVLASPASASGTPSFRALVADDLPNLDGTYVTKATTQDITATKTFTVDQSFKGSVLLYSSANLCGQIVAPGFMVFRTGASINLSDSSTYKQLSFTTSAFYPESPINLGTSGGRWANFYGANADLTGNLSLASNSHIDLGPVRLEYDSDNSALHVTTNVTSGTIPTIGLYADGFVAAGGVGGGTQYVRYVTCSLADYNALTEKDEGTIYIIGSPIAKVCLGSIQLYSEG